MTWTKIIILLNTQDFSSLWLVAYLMYDIPSGKLDMGDNLNASGSNTKLLSPGE
jgi:hypothetical protein